MSKDPYARFLEDLREIRKARKMTQAQVAKAIKISRAQYTAIERGRSLLNWRHLHRLAKTFKTRFIIRGT